MSLQGGDFFEGVYQLKSELPVETEQIAARWLADDFSGNQKKRVVIDFYAEPHSPKLHWKGSVRGLLRIGQSVSHNHRFFVWDEEEVHILTELSVVDTTEQEREAFIEMIDCLNLGPDEMVFPNDTPEYWRSDSQEVLFFYRKQVSPFADPKQNAEVIQFWKKILAPYYVPSRPEPAALPELVAVPKQPTTVTESQPTNVLVWRLGLITIGAILAVSVYFINTAYPSDGSSEMINLATFNQAIEAGISHERKGNYDQAVQYFEKAAKLPESELTQGRLDSLGYAYESFAIDECKKYKSINSSNLYFIADQYFHYASILTGKTPARKCE